MTKNIFSPLLQKLHEGNFFGPVSKRVGITFQKIEISFMEEKKFSFLIKVEFTNDKGFLKKCRNFRPSPI